MYKHVIYKDIPEDVETRFDTSNFELDRFLKEKMEVIGLMKDELGRQIMIERICWIKSKNI